MFLLNVEFSNASRFRVFRCHFSTVSRFQLPQCWHGRTEYWKLSAIFIKHSKCCDKFFMLTMSSYAFRAYSLLIQYTPLKSFTVPSALLTKFPKKFHMKLLASHIIFTKLYTKTLLLWRCRVSFEYQGLLQNTPASFLLLFVNVQASL